MRNSVQRHAIILAALLQVLPLIRNFFINPAAQSSFAFILRWGVGTAATVGAYDACSGATTVYYTTPTNFTGAVGVYFTNNIAITNNAEGLGAFFVLTNKLGVISSIISNGVITTNCMPTGLVFKCIDLNNNVNPPKMIYGAIYGTPTAPVTNLFIHALAGYANLTPAQTNIFISIFPASASPPAITNHPVSLTSLVTSNATFSVTAGGAAPLAYQWFYNTNTALLNATNASLTLTNVQLTNAGYYLIRITNSAGTTNSASALLTVWQPPIITNQPVNFTNVAGGSASFAVVAGGVPALSYQWRLNPNTPQAGATSATFNLANLRASQAGNYSVIITNSAGSVTSSPAALVVTNPLPAVAIIPVISGANFQFTFNGIPGLTNTVLTNGDLSGNNWSVFTNIPPPANNNPITITSPSGQPNLFYRLMVVP
ncbi:MAG: hypothetical protein RL616_1858 [Verrucomicrobiota bacterium]|jgi:hypothetical protein